jgi:hypothetical protein
MFFTVVKERTYFVGSSHWSSESSQLVKNDPSVKIYKIQDENVLIHEVN